MEKVKFGTLLFELTPGNMFDGDSIEITFLPGTEDFATIETEVKNSQAITVFDSAGEPIVTRSDLVYGRYIAKIDDTAMVVRFRQPDIREQLAATIAKVDYVAMMTGTEMEV